MASPTPRQLGYRMPAEWEPHAATWLSWPRRGGISFPDRYDEMMPTFAELVRILTLYEIVHINVRDARMEREVRQLLCRGRGSQIALAKVCFHHIPTNEPWCRDHGPIFLLRDADADIAVVDWGYNAWGGKYPPYKLDDVVPTKIAHEFSFPVFHPPMILEGGSIDVNGKGLLLTTEQCLLNKNRNPHLSRSAIENILRNYLGVAKILWLGEGIVGDDTDGHIDDLARFVNPATVVTVMESDPVDENYKPLQENLRRLQKMRSLQGRPLRIIPLPMPQPIFYSGQRLPACYANFYIANRSVLVPTFDDPADREALCILQKLFRKRRVIGIRCKDLIWGLGAIHCLTQQQPMSAS